MTKYLKIYGVYSLPAHLSNENLAFFHRPFLTRAEAEEYAREKNVEEDNKLQPHIYFVKEENSILRK